MLEITGVRASSTDLCFCLRLAPSTLWPVTILLTFLTVGLHMLNFIDFGETVENAMP